MTMPDYALVQGVAYKRSLQDTRRSAEWVYVRISVPPDAVPGKKSKFKAVFREHQLPAHEVISREQATELSRTSVEAWEQKLRAAAGEVSQCP